MKTQWKKLKKVIAASLIGLFVQGAQAALLDVVPQNTPAQKEFAKLLSQGQFTEGLMAWNSAFENSSFSTSDTGVALHGYLLAKSGLSVLGSHWIISDTQLSKISTKIRPEITELIKSQAAHLSTSNAHISWKKFIDDHSPITIKNNKDLNWIAVKLKKTPKSDIQQRAEYLWALTVGAAQLNKVTLAEKYVRELKGLNQAVIGEDKVEIQLARILFQRNQLNQAIDSYSMIPKTSEFWLDAIEERAWAYLKIGNYDKARSDLTTLLAPTFKDYASAEVYVLAAITNLRICDYPQILKDGVKFKERHVERIREMESLSQKGVNTHILKILDQMDQKGADLSAAAGKLSSLPRMALRSLDFSQAVNSRSRLLSEISHAEKLKQRLDAMGGNSAVNRLTAWAQKEVQKLRTKSLRELKNAASSEVAEYRVMINKLKLAEVEVIHRLNVDESLQGKRSELGSQSQGRDTLVFPFEEEVWVDELDNYQARVKDCPTTKGAAL